MIDTSIPQDRATCQTSVVATAQLQTDIAIAVRENIIRLAKGGQPQDQGSVVVGDRTFAIGPVFQMSGMTWLTLEGSAGLSIREHEIIEVAMDSPQRLAFARSHTLAHLLMASARRVVEDFVSVGTEIDETGTCTSALFQTSSNLDSLALNMIDCVTRHFIRRDAIVALSPPMSGNEGAQRFSRWRQNREPAETGTFPVVEIVGIDATPCDGSHVASTAEVGPYRLRHNLAREGDFYRLTAERTPTWMYWFGEEALIDFDWEALHMKRLPKGN
jgi:misacylated tRNA(Ala) deacylase